MPRLKENEISQDANGYYRMTKGVEPHPDRTGEYRPKVWALGPDFKKAMAKRSVIEEVWRYPGDQGWGRETPPHWTPEMFERVERFVLLNAAAARKLRLLAEEHRSTARRLATSADRLSKTHDETVDESQFDPSKPNTEAPKAAMLHAALDAYCAFVKTKPGADKDTGRAAEAIEAFKHYEADQRAMLALDSVARRKYLADPKASKGWWRDVPMAEVTYSFLERVTTYVKSRPLSRTFSCVTEGGKHVRKRLPISPYNVRTNLSHWRQCFDWIDTRHEEDAFGHWELPKRHAKLWAVNLSQIMEKHEKDAAAKGPIQINHAEIKALVDVASDEHRLWCLFALFTAQGQKEMSCTRREEIDFETNMVLHNRSKTGVPGAYWLPPEVMAMLKRHFEKHSSAVTDLVFRTREGNPLVFKSNDAVRQMYDDLRTRVAKKARVDDTVRPIRKGITFYSLRRYYGDFQNRNGVSLETALSQTFKTVGGKHYSGFRDHVKQQENAVKLHRELKEAGVFDFATRLQTASNTGRTEP